MAVAKRELPPLRECVGCPADGITWVLVPGSNECLFRDSAGVGHWYTLDESTGNLRYTGEDYEPMIREFAAALDAELFPPQSVTLPTRPTAA